MNNKEIAIILINYKDYAKKYLEKCWSSLKNLRNFSQTKVFIVDNASSEESFNFLKEQAPEAEIIVNQENAGFAKGNNDAMKIALDEGFKYVVLFNMDTIVDGLALEEMIKVLEANKKVGAVQARLLLYPEKNLINSLGNSTHFLGFGFCLNYRDEWVLDQNLSVLENDKLAFKKYFPHKEELDIFYPSGAAVLFSAQVLREIGLFDEEYFMYNEDQDLGWRIWLGGYSCLLAPRALVYHQYEFSRSISKYYYMDRNRLISIFKNYKLASLILLFPALLIMELGLLFFSLFNGSFKEKIKTWSYFLSPSRGRLLLKKRRAIQKTRKIKDKDLIDLFSGKIYYQEIASPFLKIANFFLNIYFLLFKKIIKVFNI